MNSSILLGPRPIKAQEKRLMLQNYAFFEQHSLPSAGGNIFKDTRPVPRSEAACVCCARLDWIERRYRLRLFAEPPQGAAEPEGETESDSSAEEGSALRMRHRRLLQVRGDYYLRAPAKVAALLAVERYIERWPLIPPQELHASSVEHPQERSWRWLLHTRRVPMDGGEGTAEPSTGRPGCAGIGDPELACWVCYECLTDLAGQRPRSQ